MSGNASRTRGRTYTVESSPRFDLVLEHAGKHRVVRDRPTGIFGQGPTPLDALQDFYRAAREHLDVLDGTDDLTLALADRRDYLHARVIR